MYVRILYRSLEGQSRTCVFRRSLEFNPLGARFFCDEEKQKHPRTTDEKKQSASKWQVTTCMLLMVFFVANQSKSTQGQLTSRSTKKSKVTRARRTLTLTRRAAEQSNDAKAKNQERL